MFGGLSSNHAETAVRIVLEFGTERQTGSTDYSNVAMGCSLLQIGGFMTTSCPSARQATPSGPFSLPGH
ncbi:hypothetical protein J6590_049117 [Homalodisca vitripennis]|nr:hypothetical protein J6590_049117 [Homalodisca vitripennis]